MNCSNGMNCQEKWVSSWRLKDPKARTLNKTFTTKNRKHWEKENNSKRQD